MRFSPILYLLPLAVAAPTLTSRAEDLAPQVLEQIGDLADATADLTTAVNNFEGLDGGLLSLLPQSLAVIAAETKLDKMILKSTNTVERSSNFTLTESNDIVGASAGLIGPIESSLDALIAKYPQFKRALQAPIVLLDLKILKKHTGELITALTAKVDPQTAGLLGLGAGVINQAFDEAIAVYSQ
ncbi:hypothetical protein BDW02DRAFT_592077 [Decorospora gaudefroyi]|uniref:Hydrophobic surface binding protein A n=1 Tax=Decorospora gaudefroyi TaxID=184978 RepID=A0A6A5K6V2_9PLEO|nr:hypothetical protein BDW02DRAFT_592077 [Decorospora gaudefroyi]